MPDVSNFTITANTNILTELNLHILCISNNYIRLEENKLSFSVYDSFDISVVSDIRKISKKFPDEIIYVSFVSELHYYCKEEKYEVKNGIFFFKDISWNENTAHDDSDNEPELLFIIGTKKYHDFMSNLVAYQIISE